MNTSHFRDRVVYITGGSSGIGLSAARLFSSLGSHVMIFARREDGLLSALAEIEGCRLEDSQRFSCRRMDVRDYSAVRQCLAESVAAFGAPYVLVNSAGMVNPDYFEELSCEDLEETMSVNLCGTWNTCACLIPDMKAAGGHIVNVSSMAGFIGIFGYTAYSASKFAVIGFSESLRSEMKPHGISVCVLCPTDTDTPQLRQENAARPAETKVVAGNARVMSPDDVAAAMIKGMEKGRFIIIPGTHGLLIHLAARFFPGIVRRVMDFQIGRYRRHKGL